MTNAHQVPPEVFDFLRRTDTCTVSVTERLPRAVEEIGEEEAELIALCHNPGFSIEKLESVLRKTIKRPCGRSFIER